MPKAIPLKARHSKNVVTTSVVLHERLKSLLRILLNSKDSNAKTLESFYFLIRLNLFMVIIVLCKLQQHTNVCLVI